MDNDALDLVDVGDRGLGDTTVLVDDRLLPAHAGNRVKGSVPDVDDVAGKPRQGLAPVSAVIIQHGCQVFRGHAKPLSPRRFVVHFGWRVRYEQMRFDAASTRSTSAALVLSPQISRCFPMIQTSPGGWSADRASLECRRDRRPALPRLVSVAISSSPKPVSDRSKPSASSSPSSRPSSSLSQPAFSASLLSAMM